MAVVPLAADERLAEAFARYDAAWRVQSSELTAARIELCEALLACGEKLPVEVQAQYARDRAAVAHAVVIEV